MLVSRPRTIVLLMPIIEKPSPSGFIGLAQSATGHGNCKLILLDAITEVQCPFALHLGSCEPFLTQLLSSHSFHGLEPSLNLTGVDFLQSNQASLDIVPL